MAKHFISINDLSKDELKEVLDLAHNLKKDLKNGGDQVSYLKNKYLGMILQKPSLRTRISFEIGMKQLGGATTVIKGDEISIGTRESADDIAKVLSGYLDAVMIRTFAQNPIEEMAAVSSIPIINALTDDEHPCQILADLQTTAEAFGNLNNGLKVSYIGDGNNVAHSLMLGCTQLGIECHIATPTGYEPQDRYKSDLVKITNDPKAAAQDAHVVYTDVWASMGQEDEAQERKKIFADYQVNESLMGLADSKAIVLHCLPAHKGEEISAETFDKHQEVIFRQAENRMHAQKALLVHLLA